MIIPLDAATLPDSPALLRERIEAGCRALGLLPKGVAISAPAWPAIAELELDLSGSAPASVEALPRVGTQTAGTLAVERLHWHAQPLTVHELPLGLDLRARAATLRMSRLTDGRHALVLQGAAEGGFDLSATRDGLERLAQTLLSAQARQHGVDVLKTRLSFTSRGARALSFEAEITAKIMLMKAPITVAGDLDLDDALQLRVTNLRLSGSGMAATLARGFLQPQFAKIEGKPIPLAALALHDLRLRDVSVALDDEMVKISGKFGS